MNEEQRPLPVRAFADLRAGAEIPTLVTTVDRLTLIKYCGASDDYAFIHWDHPRMVAQGFPDVLTQGWLTFAHLCRAVTDWIPREIAEIAHYAVRYRKPGLPGEVTYGGSVLRVWEEEGTGRAELDLWARNQDGAATTTATVTLAFVAAEP